jgi:hypothetical protein
MMLKCIELLVLRDERMKKEERKWFTVSGVEEEVWRMAKASAALNGEPLGVWLKSAILMYAKYCGGINDNTLGRVQILEGPPKDINDNRIGKVLEEHKKDK